MSKVPHQAVITKLSWNGGGDWPILVVTMEFRVDSIEAAKTLKVNQFVKVEVEVPDV